MGKKRLVLTAPAKIILSFLGLILVGTFLLCTPLASNTGQWWGFIDAFFTSTSAVCVTGLVVVDTAVHFTIFGQIVLLLLIQIGGLGFISISALVLVMAGKRLSYKNRVVLQESLNRDINQGVVKLLKGIAIMVFSIEAVGMICLLPSMISSYGASGIFKALFLSVSAFCNAGFDILGTAGAEFASLSMFAKNVFVLLPIMLLIVLGGIGYAVILEFADKCKKREKKPLTLYVKIVLFMTLILIVLGTLLFAIFEWDNPGTIGNMSTFEKIMNSLFQAITPRTAGFATFEQANLTSSGRVVTDVLMFIGGSPTSIAGGVKTTTMFVLLAYAFRATSKNGDIIIRKKSISNKTVQKSLRIVAMAITICVVATLAICLIEKGNAEANSSKVIFEVISAMSTVGVTLGLTPTLSVASKLVLIILMFVGRVGYLTLAFAIKRKSKDADGLIQYTDTKIIVG